MKCKTAKLLQPIMHKLTTAQILNIITILDSGLSGVQISHQTGLSTAAISCTCSEHCPDLPKSSGGRPSKLTPANISYAACLIYMGKVANTIQASKSLSDITNTSISARTLHRQLKKDGMKPHLKPHHRKARREFAERHKEWTVKD